MSEAERLEGLREALAYLRPDPANKAGLLLNAEKARAAVAAVDAELDTLRGQVAEARATNRDLHRRAQKAESYRGRHGRGINYVLNRRLDDRRARRRAEAREAAATARAAEAEARAKRLEVALLRADDVCLAVDDPAAVHAIGEIVRTALDPSQSAEGAGQPKEPTV